MSCATSGARPCLSISMIAYESEHVEHTRAATASVQATRKQTLVSRLWAARGFFGGLVAFGLAGLGQLSILPRGDLDTAGRYYAAAMFVLIISLLHPGAVRLRSRKSNGATPGPASQVAGVSAVVPVRPAAQRAVSAPGMDRPPGECQLPRCGGAGKFCGPGWAGALPWPDCLWPRCSPGRPCWRCGITLGASRAAGCGSPPCSSFC